MRKSTVNLRMFILLLVGVLVFSACSDDNGSEGKSTVDIVGVTQPDLSKIEVVETGQRSWHDHYTMLLKEVEESHGEDGSSEAGNVLAEYARQQLHYVDSVDQSLKDNVEEGDDGENTFIGYQYTNICYESVDQNGKPVKLSELIVYPYKAGSSMGVEVRNIVIGCHVTITSNFERPSNYAQLKLTTDVGMLASHAMVQPSIQGLLENPIYSNLVVIPDYQGYGATSSTAHPYLYQTLTARQVVDGTLAARAWFEHNVCKLRQGYKTIAAGYSQGGSVAMAVHRYIEQNDLDGENQLNFAGSVCGDGPYDPLTTLKTYVANDKVYMPVAAGLIIKGMCDCNPVVAGKYSPNDYFTEGFINTGIIDMIACKNYSTDEVQKRLVEYSATHSDFNVMRLTSNGDYMPYTAENKNKYSWQDATANGAVYCTVDQVMRPEVIKYIKNETVADEYKPKLEAIVKALEMNNLCKQWQPRHPMFVFHSMRDEVVPFDNYNSATAAFTGNYFKGMKYNAGYVYLHVGTGTSFYMYYEGLYTWALLKGEWLKYSHDQEVGGRIW